MKKVLSNIVIFISLLLISFVAFPWNNLGQWGINISFLNDNELLVKGGIGGFLFIVGLVFLFIANHEYNTENAVSNSTANAAFLPLWMFAVGATIYSVIMSMYVYLYLDHTTTSLIFFGGSGFLLLNFLGFGHLLSTGFKIRSNFSRYMIYLFLLELALMSAGLAYYVLTYNVTSYAALNTYNYILLLAVALGFYIIHLIILAIKKNYVNEEDLLESEVEAMEIKPSKNADFAIAPNAKSVKKVKNKKSSDEPEIDSKKSVIVGKNQSIISGKTSLDPTEMLYEDVSVDPEFTRTANSERQVNSIDYYIEKPKMFKPLDPTFDLLVEYVREFPGVITKISDEKITFYVDRNPFLVLMNYGNYYRLAFKYDLEKGIRLIIKYPTISKNKSTKDDLWFKANNYGDLPKEVVYQIVKTSFDNATK